ncbi:MAG: hypothetical protein AAB922_02875 [Patescibacteria group bacterium]
MNENKIKVGILCICLNQPYWIFAQEMVAGLNRFFLKHHTIRDKYETEIMLWSDMPETNFAGKVFPTEPEGWPLPTLLRYNLFLREEEYLKNFDYLFYIDVDMQIVDWIGEEIFGDGLTAAQHPMYALRQNLYPPYESNPESTAYIKLPGKLIEENNQKRFQPYYYAGGFQGGKTENFIKSMKVMKTRIEDDFNRNYIARWNDESHWNKYLFENPPTVVLSPAYIYPDSLVAGYYVKVWGRNFSPKIMTLTKPFSTSSEGGQAVSKLIGTM